MSVRYFKSDRLYSSCFLLQHLFYLFSQSCNHNLFPPSFSVVLAAQNVSESLVSDDRSKTVQNGVTDSPHSLNCLEQGKTPPLSHISAEKPVVLRRNKLEANK